MTARVTTIRPVPRLLLPMLLILMAAFALPCSAAEMKPAPPAGTAKAPAAPSADAAQAAAKAAIKADATPVAVDLEGTDTLGAKLSFQLKEILNSGTLFNLTDKDVPKIRIILSTAPEFPSRPEVGSSYAVVWVYYERPTAFSSYLACEVGTVSPDSVGDLAARLAERTSGLAAKYSYIFSK